MPEAITGTPWSVVEKPQDNCTYGWTDPEHKQMGLPNDDQPNAQFVRLHELGHAKFTPSVNITKLTKRYKCKEADLQVCEDLRIHSLLVYSVRNFHGAPILDSEVQPHTEANYRERGYEMADITRTPAEHLEMLTWFALQHRVTYGGRGIMSHGKLSQRCSQALDTYREVMRTNDEITVKGDALVAMLGKLAHEIANLTAKKLAGRRYGSKPLHSFNSTCKAAKELRRLLDDNSKLLPKDWNDAFDKQMMHHFNSLTHRKSHQWGNLLSVDTINLPIPHRPKDQPVKVKQSVPMGARLGHIRRLITDGRAFQRIRKLPQNGGTVLIDASGSMELATEDIHKFLDQAPATTVAMYSGHKNSGRITIIAKNGRIATERDIQHRRDEIGGGNIIDGPVLDWLSKQAQPRIWICDGYVTGVSDTEAPNLTYEAMIKAKQGNITRYNNIPEATNATSR